MALPLVLGLGAGAAGIGTGLNYYFNSRSPAVTPPNTSPMLSPVPSQTGMLTNPSSMARYGVPMAPVPPKQSIGTNEMLARAGGAIMSNSGQGGPAAYGAGLEAYGAMMDQNRELERQSAVDQYNAAAAQQKLIMDADTADLNEEIGTLDQAFADMDIALGYLNQGDITGMLDGTFGAFVDAKLTEEDSPRAYGRKLLEKLRVDDSLMRVAQTKGAISEREMDLFLAPAPNMTDQESVWIEWIRQRKIVLQNVRTRLMSGQVAPGRVANPSQVQRFTTLGATTPAPAPTPGPQGAPITNPPPILVPAPPQQQQQPAARTTTTGVQYRALPPSN